MSRSTSAVELNSFVKGLITEATPLTFPANASLDEDNFVLDRKGSRRRRLGMDYEPNHAVITTTVAPVTSSDTAIKTFRWKNAGGDPTKDFLVVQVGDEVKVFDQTRFPISNNPLYTYKFNKIGAKRFSYAVIDGTLVVATGDYDIRVFEYKDGVFSNRTVRLKIRDLFGVEDVIDGTDLRVGNGVAVRPSNITDNHLYNLRNQTFAEPRKPERVETVTDPVVEFFDKAGKYPANSDSVILSLYPDANDGDDRLTERFIAKDAVSNPVGTFPTARGFFIIDALTRGASRITEYNNLLLRHPELSYGDINLPLDATTGGATVIAEYAGRAWYAGFNGDVTNGDKHSPRMASYVLFSQLVEDPSDITNCYQDGDPTSKEEPELVDTDGGFIRIDGAYGIIGLLNVGSAIMVVAANGVWMIQGGSDYGFKATNYLVTKLTDRGCDNVDSIVVIDNTFMYWSDDGIYSVAPNQYGDYEAVNTTRNTIQSLYNNISSVSKLYCKGVYDTFEQKVRWLFNNHLASTDDVRELILDVSLGAYYTNTISSIGNNEIPRVVSSLIIPPMAISNMTEAVTVNGEAVNVATDPVVMSYDKLVDSIKETYYMVVTATSPTVKYTFSYYHNDEFTDWKTHDGVGVDATAFMLTGWLSGDDYQRNKQVPYVTFHFQKTEDGFEPDGLFDIKPTNQSSCIVSAQWDWANHANSGQWGRKFQAYRFKRHYMPADISDPFNNGYATVVTKNRLRGSGKVLSLLVETEPKKDCHLLGWSMVLEGNGNV